MVEGKRGTKGVREEKRGWRTAVKLFSIEKSIETYKIYIL
jgi:hypothetical protein